MARTLVVFFSRTDTTRTLAKRLASLLHADLEEIVDPTRRRGVLGWLRSAYEGRRARVAPIAPTRPIDGYDLVVVGTPMWATSLSSPVRAYLRRHRPQLRDVAFFCTRGGAGAHPVFRQMAGEAGREPLAELTVRASDLHSARSTRAIDDFVERLVRARPAPVEPPRAAAEPPAAPPPA